MSVNVLHPRASGQSGPTLSEIDFGFTRFNSCLQGFSSRVDYMEEEFRIIYLVGNWMKYWHAATTFKPILQRSTFSTIKALRHSHSSLVHESSTPHRQYLTLATLDARCGSMISYCQSSKVPFHWLASDRYIQS